MKTRFFLGLFIIMVISIIICGFNNTGNAQYINDYSYLWPTSIGPSWSSTPTFSAYTPTSIGLWSGFSPFVFSGIPDFGNFGFGYYGYPGTGALGGYGSPIPTLSAARPFGSFGVTSSGPSWSTSLLGIPSWIIYGIAGPWFSTPLF